MCTILLRYKIYMKGKYFLFYKMKISTPKCGILDTTLCDKVCK